VASDFDVKKDTQGQFYWLLSAANGEIIARSSESYRSKRDCLHSIKLVKEIAPRAPVWDLTETGATRIEGELP
jgi:uncharacterized protein YegP (UPF0339 family)